MKRLVIAVDCDDVLIPSQAFLVNTYNQLYGANVELGQEFEDWGEDYDEVMRRCGEIAQSDAFKKLSPSPEGVSVLERLAQHHELHLVTARKAEERAFTEAAIERVLPGVFASMEFIGWTASKGEVCQRIGADVLIDDNAHHLHGALEKGLPAGGALLFGNYPWNKANHDDKSLRLCVSWDAVEAVVASISSGEDNGTHEP